MADGRKGVELAGQRAGEEVLSRFVLDRQVEDGASPLTLASYRSVMRPFLRWLGGRDTLAVPDDGIREYLAGVFREHENAHTRFTHVKILKVFYRWAGRKGLLPAGDPTAGVRTPRLPEQVDRVYSVQQIDAMRQACPTKTFLGRRDRTMLEIAFDCGLRSVELRRLAIADIDWNERVLRVRGKAGPGRPAPVRDVPFGVSVTRALRRYVELRRILPGDALLVDRRGLALSRRNMVRIMQRIRSRAGIPASDGRGWHAMRHAFVTEMLRSGADGEHLRRMAGHRDQRMLARYAHLLTADLRREHDRHGPADRLLRE